jgi:5-methylcytosine-specific restriction endonuclease McrA
MRLCWDNLENIRYNKNNNNFRDIVKKKTYYLKICEKCGDNFLGMKDGRFCCNSCALSGEKHPLYGKRGEKCHNYGKGRSEETKKKISNSLKGENCFWYGKHRSDETKRKISNSLKGDKHPNYGKHRSDKTKRKIRESQLGEKSSNYGKRGENSYSWKGGYHSSGIPTYDVYAPQIDWCEDVRRNLKDRNVLEVKCTNCGKWYVPNLNKLKNRIEVLKGVKGYKGEQRLYCSNKCKQSCPLYHKKPETLMKEDAVRAGRLQWLELGREVQSELRQMVLERDEYTCQKCGSTENLHCHHILPVAIEPLLSADVDNCITLCKQCHKEAHSQDGCKLNQLKMDLC